MYDARESSHPGRVVIVFVELYCPWYCPLPTVSLVYSAGECESLSQPTLQWTMSRGHWQLHNAVLEEIQRKSRVREWTPQNAPRIRAGVTKKDQKAELKKNQTRRCYAEKTSIFFQTTGRHPPGARRETTEVKTRKC